MKKTAGAFDLDSALKKKAAQRRKYSDLPVSKKLRLLDRLHDNAASLRGFHPKSKSKE